MKTATRFQLLASLLSAFFLAALWEPFQQGQAIFFALVPLLLLIRTVSPKRAFWWGCLTGFLSWVVQLSWMWKLTDNDGPWILILPALLGLSAYLALFIGCFAALAAKLRRLLAEKTCGNATFGGRILLVLLGEPILWAGFESLRSNLLTGFAWNPLGLASTDYLYVAQAAALGGVTLVSALLVAVNGAIATIAERIWQALTHTSPTNFLQRTTLSLESFLPLGLFAFVCLWGNQRIAAYDRLVREEGQIARIAVQYTEIPSIFTGAPIPAPWEIGAERVPMMALLKPDLWLWPESSVYGLFPRNTQVIEAYLAQLARAAQTPLLMGGTYVHGVDHYANAAMLFTEKGLDHTQVYSKRHLVPFGEYLPMDDKIPALKALVPTGLSLTPGEKITTLTLPSGLIIGPLICFEDTVASVACDAVNDGARLLVNMSNDAWYTPSFEAEQHARQAIMRCIETGTPMVRSTNRGRNTRIDAIGRSTTINPQEFPTMIPVTPQPFASAYLAYGDRLFGGPCVLLTLCLAALFLIGRYLKKPTVVVALFLLVATPAFATTPLIPMADMAMDDGNINLAERTARSILATFGISSEERAKAQEILIRAELAKRQWESALKLIEQSPELPVSHRLVLSFAAYNGSKQFTRTQNEYEAAKLPTDDAWGVAALRLVLQADLALGSNLRAAQHFEAIDSATGADDVIRAENALLWTQHFPNDTSRAALLRSARLATKGEPFLSCATALPKSFAANEDRKAAFALLDELLEDEALGAGTRTQLALSAIDLALSQEQKVDYARRAVKTARKTEDRYTALARLGELLCNDTKTATEGISVLKEAVQLNPSAATAPTLQLQIAEKLQSLEKYDEALKAYDHYLSSYDMPELRVRVRQGKARTLMAANRPDEALATFTEAADWAPKGAAQNELLRETAEAAMAAKRYTRAITLYRDLQKRAPSPEITLHLAFALEASGDKEAARTAYTTVRNDPKASKELVVIAILHLGELYAEEERFQDALAEFSKALDSAKEPYREQLLLARGRTYYALGKLDRARDDVATVCESKDASLASEARFIMVLSLYGLGEDERAREFAQAYVAAYPDSTRLPDIFLWIAKSDFNRGEYEAAMKGFESFGTRWPQEARVPQSLFLAARAAYQDQDYLKVVELVGRLAKEFPQTELQSDARFLQAEALMELARHAEARELLSALILRYPTAAWIGEAYGHFGDCLFTTATDDPERAVQALEAYREAVTRLEHDPDSALMYLYKIGRVFEKQNRRDDAAEQYTKSVYRVLNNPGIYSSNGLRWLEKILTQLQMIERARGNLSSFETLRRRLQAAHIPGLTFPYE